MSRRHKALRKILVKQNAKRSWFRLFAPDCKNLSKAALHWLKCTEDILMRELKSPAIQKKIRDYYMDAILYGSSSTCMEDLFNLDETSEGKVL